MLVPAHQTSLFNSDGCINLAGSVKAMARCWRPNVRSSTHTHLSWDITTTQVNSALHPSGVAKSSTSFGWGKGGKVTSAGWQVTLCDIIWRVISRSGVVISITNCYIRFTYLLTYLHSSYGDRSFAAGGPLLWNRLPLNMRHHARLLPTVPTRTEDISPARRSVTFWYTAS